MLRPDPKSYDSESSEPKPRAGKEGLGFGITVKVTGSVCDSNNIAWPGLCDKSVKILVGNCVKRWELYHTVHNGNPLRKHRVIISSSQSLLWVFIFNKNVIYHLLIKLFLIIIWLISCLLFSSGWSWSYNSLSTGFFYFVKFPVKTKNKELLQQQNDFGNLVNCKHLVGNCWKHFPSSPESHGETRIGLSHPKAPLGKWCSTR